MTIHNTVSLFWGKHQKLQVAEILTSCMMYGNINGLNEFHICFSVKVYGEWNKLKHFKFSSTKIEIQTGEWWPEFLKS